MKEQCKKIAKQLRRIAKGESLFDAKQFRELAVVVESGDMKKAWKVYKNMETFNREAIHGDLLNFLYINRTKGKKHISVKIKTGDKMLYKTELTFPTDADDQEMGMAIVHWESEQRKELLSFEYGDVKKVRGVM